MNGTSILTSFILAVLFLGAAPAAAKEPGGERRAADRAHDDEMARTLFETGRAYFERAKYDEAAESFGEAYRLSGRAPLLVNQARALEAGGRYAEAIEVLETFLEVESEDVTAREGVNTVLKRLRATQAREAAEEGEREDSVEVEPESEPEPEPPAAPLAQAPLDPKPSLARIAGWSAVGLGGASGIVALATGLVAHDKMSSLEDQCPMDVCPPELQGTVDAGHRLAVTSTVFTFVGVAAAASGVLVLVLKKDTKDDPEGTTVELTPGPAARGAGLRVTF